MEFIATNYFVDIEKVSTLVSTYGLAGAAKLLSEEMDKNIDNTYAAGTLYALSLRENAMSQKELLESYPTLFSEKERTFMLTWYDHLEAMLVPERDFGYKYASIRDIASNYLFKVNGKSVESVQWMWMRVAVQVGFPDIEEIERTYHILSKREAIHATPTCVNACFRIPQLESCFLVAVGDSMLSIADAHKLVAMGSKCNGGFGIDVGRIRHSRVSNRGITKGVPGLLKLFNTLIPYADQLGSRPGACTAYCPIWHTDIETFIRMKDRNSPEATQCTNLNYAVCIPDLFYRRVMAKGVWSLFCPRDTQLLWARLHNIDNTDSKAVDACPCLHDLSGETFDVFYLQCEEAGIATKTIDAVSLHREIHEIRATIGEPFIFNTDNVNRKSNHSHLGTVTQSNLCVRGDTMILTSKGYLPISSLVGTEIDVWNGLEWSTVTPMQTGTGQKLLTVTFSNGSTLHCTLYHKFYLQGNEEAVPASSLVPDDTIIDYTLPDNSVVSGVYVVSVSDEGEIADTFCFNETMRHMGIFNGILTGNCTEITQYTKPNEMAATCDLATVNLASLVRVDSDGNKSIDWKRLGEIIRQLTRNLNRVLDATSGIVPNEGQRALEEHFRLHPEDRQRPLFSKMYASVEKDPTYTARMQNRAIGIGAMGLASMFALLGVEFTSKEAAEIGTRIRAAIYWHSVDESVRLADIDGAYPTFAGSPMSKGILQQDMWFQENEHMKSLLPEKLKRYEYPEVAPSEFGISDTWQNLRIRVQKGVRNSLFTVQMPNVTTSAVFGVSPSCEPFYEIMFASNNINGTDKNIYDAFREVLVRDHIYRPQEMAKYLKEHYGRVEGMHSIFPEGTEEREKCKKLESLFIPSFSINKKKYILMLQRMAHYIDQATSLNIFYDKPNAQYLADLSMLAWANGNKTEYYLRRLPPAEKISTQVGKPASPTPEEKLVCSRSGTECRWCS